MNYEEGYWSNEEIREINALLISTYPATIVPATVGHGTTGVSPAPSPPVMGGRVTVTARGWPGIPAVRWATWGPRAWAILRASSWFMMRAWSRPICHNELKCYIIKHNKDVLNNKINNTITNFTVNVNYKPNWFLSIE